MSYVMARRRAVQTQFVTLIESYGVEPAVIRFERQADGSFLITGPTWQDTVRFVTDSH